MLTNGNRKLKAIPSLNHLVKKLLLRIINLSAFKNNVLHIKKLYTRNIMKH